MLACFEGELVHKIRSGIGERLVVEFDQIEDAGSVGKIEREGKMFGAQVLADRAALYGLVVKMEFLARERKRVGLDILLFASCQARDDGRINAAAQENADRDIANKLALYRGGEALADGRFQLVIG